VKLSQSSASSKKHFLNCYRLLVDVCNGRQSAFAKLTGHAEEVNAMYYHDGILATGTWNS
jgi:hypothetical protein